MSELSPEVLKQLYTTVPEDFLSVRQGLVGEAKRSGDAELARELSALRKPTLAAWIVNRHVHEQPSVLERLLGVGTRLRTAHEQLDAAALRELSAERRHLVADLSAAALAGADRTNAASALRDDVADTFDAAVADPQIAARLGRLTRGETWSGFGVAATDPSGSVPELTVIRGGRDRSAAAPKRAARSSAESDRAERAAAAFAAAETAVRESEDAESSAASRVAELSAELERVQRTLHTAQRDHDRAKQQLRSARNRRREASTKLERAERKAPGEKG